MEATLEVPAILDIPSKLKPIIENFNHYTYCLLEGGRGGGKSQAMGRCLLYWGEQRKIRIVCGRETQNTIAESVYSLMADLIRAWNLDYEIQANKLIHRKTGTEITFRGFRQQGAFNIQGMEGVDIIWIDEAQAITKRTMEHLMPTIRKEKSKIFFTMNRHVVNDPAYQFCKDDPDCLHIHINYTDNKYCTSILLKQAEKCRIKNPEDYNHIWLGQPLEKTEDAVFALEELIATGVNKYPAKPHYGLRIAGMDVARFGDDKCCVVIIQQMGALHWEVIHIQEWGQRDTVYTSGMFLEIYNQYDCSHAVIDEDGIGGPVLDSLNKGRGLNSFVGFRNPSISYNDNKDFANNRTVNTYKLKDMVSKGHIAITQDSLIKELVTLRYTYDHQQRKILLSKDQMRKDGVKSPNQADALIMAVSLVNEVKESQDKQYVPRGNYNAPDDNLFSIAGVR